MILIAVICFALFLFLLALYLVLAFTFAMQNKARQRRMERDMRIFEARQKFYMDKAKWN